MYLVDTNVCIKAIEGLEPDAAFLNKAIERNELVLSVITVAEFLSKASTSEQESFGKLTGTFPVLEIKFSTAQLAAEFRRNSKKTTRISLLDCFLAAQAYENDLTLVTNNVADFPIRDITVRAP